MKTAIRQHDETDCAAACIASIARHYGVNVPLTFIREASGTSSAGTSIKGILDACRRIGFKATGYKSDDKALEGLYGLSEPVILHEVNERGDLHFVVLESISPLFARIMDPAEGRSMKLPADRLREQWTGYLVTMVPDDGVPAAEMPKRHSLFHCLKYVPARDFLLMTAGSMVYIVAGLCTALFLQHIIDDVLPAGSTAGLLRLGALMLAVMLCTLLVGYGRVIYTLRSGLALDARLILDYLRHLFRLPASFFSRRGAGELHARIGDVARVRNFLVEGSSTLVTGLLILAVSFTLMFSLHWRLALLMLAFVPLYLTLYTVADRVNRRVNRDIIEQSAVFEERTVEGITAVQVFRHFGSGNRMLHEIEREYRHLVARLLRGGRWADGFASAADGIAKLSTVTLLTAGALYIFSGSLTVGALVSFYSLTTWFSAPLADLVGLGTAYCEARIAYERLGDITLLPEEDAGIESFLPEPGADLVFDHITFSYPGGAPLLNDFSLTLKRGTITAIQGPSGCGKTSLAALLMRDYAVQQGVIRLGLHDIRLYWLEAWRKFVTIVPQEPHLISASLLDNITGQAAAPDVERVARLLEELDLGPLVRSLPLGLFTKLGERGCLLSGGQRQRIALARALYRQPHILILDEVTSALDAASQEILLSRVKRFRDEGGTVMMITHKADNAAIADTIVTL